VSLLGQLLWREFYYAAAAHTPNYHQKEGNPICKQIPWDDNMEYFKVSLVCTLTLHLPALVAHLYLLPEILMLLTTTIQRRATPLASKFPGMVLWRCTVQNASQVLD